MEDLPAIALLQQSHAKDKTGQELEVLGKTAAKKYIGGELTLSKAVVETVKTAGLSPEQVKRVAEFANTEAYLDEFRKEGEHKVIEFKGGPADPSVILQDLNDGGGGTVFDKGDGDYNYPPPDVKQASVSNRSKMELEEPKLAEAFHVKHSEELPYADPFQEAMEVRDKLASAYDQIDSELTGLETMYMDLGDELYKQVKQASLNGISLGRIIQGWHAVTDEPEYVKVAFQLLTPQLLEQGVFPSRVAMADSMEDIEKVATVNTEHPIVKDFKDFCEAITKVAQARALSEELAEGVEQMNAFMKQARKSSYVEAARDLVRKGWHGAKGLAETGAQAAEKNIPGTPGTVAAGALRASPYLGAAVGGEAAYEHARYGPTLAPIRGAVESVYRAGAGRVPGSKAKAMRRYQIATGR